MITISPNLFQFHSKVDSKSFRMLLFVGHATLGYVVAYIIPIIKQQQKKQGIARTKRKLNYLLVIQTIKNSSINLCSIISIIQVHWASIEQCNQIVSNHNFFF